MNSSELRTLAETARRDGWASANDVDLDSLRLAAAVLRWREVPIRRGDAGVAVLRPKTRETARPSSMSAAYGLDAQPLHTDGAHLPEPPDLVLLACQDTSSTPTLLWNGRNSWHMDAPTDALTDGMFLVNNRRDSFFAPAVTGFKLRFDPVCMTPCDSRARTALAYFAAQRDYAERHQWTEAGILLINNRQVLHARAAVAPSDETRTLVRIAFSTTTEESQ